MSHFSGHTPQCHLSSRVSPATVLVAAGHHYTAARGCHLAFTTLLTCHVTQAFVTAVANTCTVWNNKTQRARTIPAQPKCRNMRTRVATERFSEQAHVTDCHDKTASYFRKSFYVMQSCHLNTSPKFLTSPLCSFSNDSTDSTNEGCSYVTSSEVMPSGANLPTLKVNIPTPLSSPVLNILARSKGFLKTKTHIHRRPIGPCSKCPST